MRLALPLLTLLFACSDDPEPAQRDATVADGSVDATAPRADSSALDAGGDCYSALRPPSDGTYPQGRGCKCDPKVEREPYCVGRSNGGSPYLLACDGFWGPAKDGNCAPFGGAAASCTARGHADRPDGGGCGRGYAPVSASFEVDGGLRSPPCCDTIVVTGTECTAEGFEHQSLVINGNGTITCKDGRLPLGWVPAFEPEGCCER